MKNLTCSLGLAAFTLLLSVPALADDKRELSSNLCKASDVIGMNVQNSKGEDLGEIEEIVIDRSNGRVAYAVLSFGGFLGMGDDLHAVPWKAFQREKDHLVLNVTKQKLKQAKGFPKDRWPNMADRSWAQNVHNFYGQEPYWYVETWTVYSVDEQDLNDQGLKRESAQLDLKLDRGKQFRYELSNTTNLTPVGYDEDQRDQRDRNRQQLHDNTRLVFMVQDTSGDRVTLDVSMHKSGETGKSYEVITGRNGNVHSVRCTSPGFKSGGGMDGMDREKETARKGEDEAMGRDEDRTGKNEMTQAEEAHIRSCIEFVLGNGLHGDELQPGQSYNTNATLDDLLGEKAMMKKEDRARKDEKKMRVKSVALSFRGIKEVDGDRCALFHIEGEKQSSGSTTGELGRAAYNLSDGLLEQCTVKIADREGRITMRRLDATIGRNDERMGGR